jgi:hypothetical protein
MILAKPFTFWRFITGVLRIERVETITLVLENSTQAHMHVVE